MREISDNKPRNKISGTFREASFVSGSIPKKGKKNPSDSPFSLRLTFEERARLEREAGSQSLGSYIRSKLFGEAAGNSRTRTRYPVKDHQALAKLLGELGGSRIANNLNQLAKAANCGSLDINPETEAELLEACEAIKAMRRDLVVALGLGDGGSS